MVIESNDSSTSIRRWHATCPGCTTTPGIAGRTASEKAMWRRSVTVTITSATTPTRKASSTPLTARLRIEPPGHHRERQHLEHCHPAYHQPGRELAAATAQQRERGRNRHSGDRHQRQQVAPLDPDAVPERDELAVLEPAQPQQQRDEPER